MRCNCCNIGNDIGILRRVSHYDDVKKCIIFGGSYYIGCGVCRKDFYLPPDYIPKRQHKKYLKLYLKKINEKRKRKKI